MDTVKMERAGRMNAMRRESAWMRIGAQIRFGEHVADTDARRGRAWKKLIERARVVTSEALASETVDWPQLVARVESILAPLSGAAKARTLHLVGHAHMDMNWMWSWPETVAGTLDTFRTMLDLLEEFPDFHFSQSQASMYEIVEKYEPDMLPLIARYVEAGRWEVTASHWVECDKNMVGGEALCRHLLYTRAYMKRLFNLEPEDVTIDWAPDTFGHAATVPGYLCRGGVPYLYMHRPGQDRQPVPEAFWWEGPDGSRVLVRNDQNRGYNGVIRPDEIIGGLTAMHGSVGLDFAMLVYGVGDHGGGPTRRDLLAAQEMNGWPVFPTLLFGTVQAFFRKLEKAGAALPVLRGELNVEFAGCYTSQSLIKRSNRLAEARLVDAEFAAVADRMVTGAAYPDEALAQDWKRTLFSHFHDILPGSGVRDTRTYTHGRFQETAASTGTLTTRALRHVAAEVDTASLCGEDQSAEPVPALFIRGGQGAGVGIGAAEGRMSQAHRHGASEVRPFVIFNSTQSERSEVVRLTVWDRDPAGTPAPFHGRSFDACDAAGKPVTVQVLGKGFEWGHQNQTLAVPVTVPALGYSTVALLESPAPSSGVKRGVRLTRRSHHCGYACSERNVIGMENDQLSVAFDRQTGRLVSFFDKRAGEERIDAATGGMGFEYSVERPHGMSSWLIESSGPAEFPALKRVEDVADGPLIAELRMEYSIMASTITARYELHAGAAELRIALEIDWFERGDGVRGVPNLRLALPTALRNVTARYEIPFGALNRKTAPDQEVPALRWAGLSGLAGKRRAAVVLFNDCKHGHAVDGSTLRLNLVRSSYEPDYLPEVDRHTVRLALLSTGGSVSDAELTARAAAHEQPLLTMGTEVHDGRLPAAQSLLTVKGVNVALSGLKWAESGEGLVVRLASTAAGPTRVRLTCASALGSVDAAQPLDLSERPSGPIARGKGGSVSVTVPARGFGTWLVRIRSSRASRAQ